MLLLTTALAACAAPPRENTLASQTVPLSAIVVRLLPGADPQAELERLVRERGIEAAFVLSCAGSLRKAVVRYADRSEPTVLEEKLEVVSLSGTLSARGGTHLHVSLSDGQGRTVGGHLKDGSEVYTTLEVALGVPAGVGFTRMKDDRTGYAELFVEDR